MGEMVMAILRWYGKPIQWARSESSNHEMSIYPIALYESSNHEMSIYPIALYESSKHEMSIYPIALYESSKHEMSIYPIALYESSKHEMSIYPIALTSGFGCRRDGNCFSKLVFISQVDFENFRFQWLPKFPLASFLTGRSDCHFLHLKYCLASKTYKNCYGPKFSQCRMSPMYQFLYSEFRVFVRI